MELQKQLTSLSLSQRLKELGVKQDSQFYWVQHWKNQYLSKEIVFSVWTHEQVYDFNSKDMTLYSAYSVAELDALLPEDIETPDEDKYWGGGDYSFIQTKSAVMYGRYGTEVVPDALYFEIKDGNTAETYGEMLCYLLEHNLITLD